MIGRKILRVLLMMAMQTMVIVLLPGIGLTAKADAELTFDSLSENMIIDATGGRQVKNTLASSSTIKVLAHIGDTSLGDWTQYTQVASGNSFTLPSGKYKVIEVKKYSEFHFYTFKPIIDVTSITLTPSDAQTIYVDGKVFFTVAVFPDNATNKNVKWLVVPNHDTAPSMPIQLFSDADCTQAVSLNEATETLTVYAKGISQGGATVKVQSDAVSSITSQCLVTVNPKTTYAITVASGITGGSVVSDKATAAEGDTVTLTATPDTNFGLNTLTATKASGGTVDVTQDASDTSKYTFTMPGEAVTVAAEFKAIPAVPTDVAWNGKTVSWNAAEGATGYEYKWTVGTDYAGTGEVAEGTSVDLAATIKDFMDTKPADSAVFVVSICAKNGNVKSAYSDTAEKQFVRVIVAPSRKDIASEYYIGDTIGGTVSGQNFSDPDENGKLVGIFGVGDTVTFSAAEKKGYEFKGFEYWGQSSPITDPSQKDQSFVMNGYKCTIYARFDQVVLPVNVNLVIGEGHSAYAGKLLDTIKSRYPHFADQMSVLEEGKSLSLVIPSVDDRMDSSEYGELITTGRLQYFLDSDAETAAMLVGQDDPDARNSYVSVTQTNSIDNYTSDEDIYEREMSIKTLISDNQTYYVLWGRPIEKIGFNVDLPVCGTQIELVNGTHPKDEKSQPQITIVEGGDKFSFYKMEDAAGKEYDDVFWMVKTGPIHSKFSGPIKGGNQYEAMIGIKTVFGYYVKKDYTKTQINNTVVEQEQSGKTPYLFASFTAVHDWQTPEIVKPTLVTEGYERRLCKHVATCHGSEITKTFPKVTYSNTSGDGNVWTKGSNTTSDFTFIRSYEDTSFSFFKGIQVDGKSVDASNYKATKGSTVVKLNAAYLEKITVGGHTITAIFSEMIPDRGPVEATASARFTVKEKSSGGGDSSKPSKPIDNVVTCQMAGYPSNYVWNEAAKACQAGYLDAAGKFHPYGRSIPNTYDPNTVMFAYLAMIAMTIACFCGVKLLHEDWEV